jgi:hypothetical protein
MSLPSADTSPAQGQMQRPLPSADTSPALTTIIQPLDYLLEIDNMAIVLIGYHFFSPFFC